MNVVNWFHSRWMLIPRCVLSRWHEWLVTLVHLSKGHWSSVTGPVSSSYTTMPVGLPHTHVHSLPVSVPSHSIAIHALLIARCTGYLSKYTHLFTSSNQLQHLSSQRSPISSSEIYERHQPDTSLPCLPVSVAHAPTKCDRHYVSHCKLNVIGAWANQLQEHGAHGTKLANWV